MKCPFMTSFRSESVSFTMRCCHAYWPKKIMIPSVEEQSKYCEGGNPMFCPHYKKAKMRESFFCAALNDQDSDYKPNRDFSHKK